MSVVVGVLRLSRVSVVRKGFMEIEECRDVRFIDLFVFVLVWCYGYVGFMGVLIGDRCFGLVLWGG